MADKFITIVEMSKRILKSSLGDYYDEDKANRYTACLKFMDNDIEKDFPTRNEEKK